MYLKFSPQGNVKEVKQKFHSLFPFLKIEFFNESHKKNEGNSAADLININTKLVELNPNLQEEQLLLNPLMLVSEFESAVKLLFNVNVQVFRRANSVWLETTKTDDWTLAKQNLAGQESLSPIIGEKIAYEDLDVE